MNLYELPAAYAAWEHALEEAGGELTPELEAALEGLGDDLHARAEAACALVRNALAEAAMCRDEAARLGARARSCERRADRLRELLAGALRAAGRDRVQAGRFRVALRRSSTPRVRWTGGPEDLPEDFILTRHEVDYARLRLAWERGTLPPGFEATFTESVVIR